MVEVLHSRVLTLTLLVAGFLCLGSFSCSHGRYPQALPAPAPSTAEEYWQDQNEPSYLLGMEGSRLTVSYGGRVREVVEVLDREEADARICYSGRESKTLLRLVGSELIFHDPFRDRTHHLRRLREKPSALSLTFLLPDPAPIAKAKVEEVQRELSRRSQEDQALIGRSKQRVLTDDLPWMKNQSGAVMPPDLGAEIQFADLTIQNSAYIRKLLLDIGWIDVERFGYGASNAAFLLVQHSWDVPVMTAVLPRLKRDVDRGLMEPDTYALMYDRLQLALGVRQRYGTQIARTPEGEVIVLPVEDAAQVESFRRQLGLIPLAEYVRVFGASEVRFSSECGSSSGTPG
jgi:hypothetical protein